MIRSRPAKIAALALTLAAVSPASAQPLAPAAHSWRSMSTHAPELRPVLGSAIEALPGRAPLAGVFRAEQQFIGQKLAYRLILVMADQTKWRVTLLPDGDGKMRASMIEPVP